MKSALLIMDYQYDILKNYENHGALLKTTARLLANARKTGVPVFYVRVAFREGYPEVSPNNKMFAGLKSSGRLIEAAEGSQIHKDVAPLKSEGVVTKRRVGPFSTTDLETLLRSNGVEHLILCGVATSGVVLSTVRTAADLDYAVTVIQDGCADADPAVHQVLMEKIFPRQCEVIPAEKCFLWNA
jgi:nicotinamidase-related amidase